MTDSVIFGRRCGNRLAVFSAAMVVSCLAQTVRADYFFPDDKPADDAAYLMLQPIPESVYQPPEIIVEEEGYNEGAVELTLNAAYLTDYVFRGFEPLEVSGGEDAANAQFDAKLSFDLGRLPHPFVRVFTNTAESDDVSKFQVIRPTVGFDWTLNAVTLSAGQQAFLYPDRDGLDTSEVFVRLELDDSGVFRRDTPIFSPYIFAAYDYDLYDGTYIEGGVEHAFQVPDLALTFTFSASVAYVDGYEGFFSANPANPEGSGFQHYQLGLVGRYDVNTLLNISRRYGQWAIEGYLFYTDGIDDELVADTQLWGGAGIAFRY